MNYTTEKFINYLKKEDIKYNLVRQTDDYDLIEITYTGDNMQNITVSMYFYGNELIEAHVFSIANVPNDKMYNVLEVINKLNAKYRWVKFQIDDNTVCASRDVHMYDSDIEVSGHDTLIHLASLTDDCYPEIMRAIWS